MRRAAVAGIALLSLSIVAVGACSDEAAPPLPTEDVTGPTDSADAAIDPTATTEAPTDAPTEAPTTTTTTPPTTTTLPPLVTKGAVVLVANAADVPGAAGRLSQALQRVGYAVNPATNAAGWEIRLDTTKVYYLARAKKAARSLAARMGVEAFPMPVPVPIEGAYDSFGNTTVLVMLGRDLADKPIPGIS